MAILFSAPDIPLSDIRRASHPSDSRDDPFLYIERQSRHLQQQIQSLLDAQSDGLLASMRSPHAQTAPEHASTSDIISTTTTTSPPRSTIGSLDRRSARTIPVRQPSKKRIGLRAARKGILRSMSDLLSLREEERSVIQTRIQERQDTVAEVNTFAQKKERLEKTICDIELGDREGKRAQEMKAEARHLEQEIEELEVKLADMKARHRHLVNEVSRIDNAVDAKLSSYKESLSILDTEVRQYLRSPPLPLPLRPDTDKASFYSLHPNRRTLEMARDHWQAEQTELMERLHNVDQEIAALDEGGPLWQTVVKEISAFERKLKDEMQQQQKQSILLSSKPTLPGGVDLTDQQEQGNRIISDIENTANRIEAKLRVAEERNWSLLVCSIGAEVAALREAQSILKQTFAHNNNNTPPEDGLAPLSDDASKGDEDDHEIKRNETQTSLQDHHNQPQTPQDANTKASDLHIDSHTTAMAIPIEDEHLADEPPADLLEDVSTVAIKATSFRSEDEDDDEPDPAWLLSDS